MPTSETLEAILHTPQHELSGLATVALKQGELVYEGYFGRRFIDSENPTHDLPVDAQTKFRVASISKIAVSLAMMRLVEQGKLDLDRDIGDYLGYPARNPHFPQQPITARMLLSHTSSLRDGNLGYSVPLPQTLEVFFKPSRYTQDGSHFAPQPMGFFCYCNLNFGVMGTLIECLSGQRFDRYMRQHILEPLGLEASYNVRDFSQSQIGNLAALYRKGQNEQNWNPEGPWVPQAEDYRGQLPDEYRVENPNKEDRVKSSFTLEDYRIGSNGTLFSPQGGLRISARDLSKLMRLLMNGGELEGVRLIEPQTLEQMLTPQWRYNPDSPNGDTYSGQSLCWALGLQQFTHTRFGQGGDRLLADTPLRWVGHLGDAYGLLGGFFFDRQCKNGLIYLIGGVGSNPETYRGHYASLSRWEEQIITALAQRVL